MANQLRQVNLPLRLRPLIIGLHIAFVGVTVHEAARAAPPTAPVSSSFKQKQSAPKEEKVPNAIELVAHPLPNGERRMLGDRYWQLELKPNEGYDVASSAQQQSAWEKLLGLLWSKTETAAVVANLVLAPNTPGSPTPERPVMMMKKKDGIVDQTFRVKPESVTGYFRNLSDTKARVDVQLGYSSQIDQKVVSAAVAIIEAVGPALSLPARWVNIAASKSTKQTADGLDMKLSQLLTSSTPSIASKEIDLATFDALEIRPYGGGHQAPLAVLKIRDRDSILAATLKEFPEDPLLLLRTPAPSTFSTEQKPLRDIVEKAVNGRATETGAQFDSYCELIDRQLVAEGYNGVDRAAVLAAWLVDRGYDSSSNFRTGAPRGCEARVKALADKGANVAWASKSKEALVQEEASQGTSFERSNNSSLQKRYEGLYVALSSGNVNALLEFFRLSVQMRTDVNSQSLEALEIARSAAESQSVDTNSFAEALQSGIEFKKGSKSCFQLLSNAQPNQVWARCFVVDKTQMTALLSFDKPAWDVSSKITEVRFQLPAQLKSP